MDARACRQVTGLVIAAVAGCAAPAEDEAALGVSVAALSVCDETVPPERIIDGIPAYAQCDAVQNSAVYSNNGVDTSTTSLGADWIRTQYSGGYQCTELAHRYLHFVWNIDWTPRGNAGTWCDSEPPADSGMVQTASPVHGDIMVLAPGSCGASPSTGHVNVIDEVDASGQLFAVEQNRAGRGRYQASCAHCFLHVVANDDGVPPPGAGVAGSAASGTGGVGGTDASAGQGASAGSGAAGTPAMQPVPTAGAASPEPTPAPAVPVPSPVVMPPPAQEPSPPVAAPTAVTVQPPPPPFVPQRTTSMPQQESGCSVVHPGARRTTPLAWLLLGLLATRGRRRQT